ncbi:hypothetical protein TRVA0_001S09252 [Trichomonascus vanleenenianus]|uniref:Bns1p n=1 Tax=Trichomonascus vanleenenianus TaxID=2268995 RepID=UPI003EC9B0D4
MSTQQVNIEPLHHNVPKGNALHRQLLNRSMKGQNFASPTDSLMSPCSQKIQAHKNKHFQRAKPQMLFKQFSHVKSEDDGFGL